MRLDQRPLTRTLLGAALVIATGGAALANVAPLRGEPAPSRSLPRTLVARHSFVPGQKLGPLTCYQLPGPNKRPIAKQPADITAGPDGAVWFTEQGLSPYGPAVGRLTPDGYLDEYPLPPSSPTGVITTGPDGALWIAGDINVSPTTIGRITTDGHYTSYALNGAGAQGIAAGPDGALWFASANRSGGSIGRITTTGNVTQYPLPSSPAVTPADITAGPDGAMWFTAPATGGVGTNVIGRITTSGSITEYAVPSSSADVNGITAGPDGALWFTEYLANKAGRITTAGSITEYPLSGPVSDTFYIASGSDGNLWYTRLDGYIGRITTAGASLERKVKPSSALPYGVTSLGNTVWFTEFAWGTICSVPG